MDKTFEDRVFDKIVDQFFALDQNGNSGMRMVAYQMFNQRQADIMRAVEARLNTEELAEALAKIMLDNLKSKEYGYGSTASEQTELKKRVREKVATALAERELARMDAQASEEQDR